VIERAADGLFSFYRMLGGASEGARTIERDGVIASLVPAAPERAVTNGVAYRSAEALEAAYEEIAEAYREIGANWTVWVWPDHAATARFLEGRGHTLDATPTAMVHDLDGLERPAADTSFDWTADGDFTALGPLNDRAYGFGTDSFTRALRTPPGDSFHVYVASDGGEPVGCVTVTDHDGNSDVESVAVVPEARGRGISGHLLGHALVDAAERGNESSTLMSTALGYPVYERLGFRPLGSFQMWERAADA
jgi:GNAT superfamily N-acetyltransferase